MSAQLTNTSICRKTRQRVILHWKLKYSLSAISVGDSNHFLFTSLLIVNQRAEKLMTKNCLLMMIKEFLSYLEQNIRDSYNMFHDYLIRRLHHVICFLSNVIELKVIPSSFWKRSWCRNSKWILNGVNKIKIRY